MHPSSKSERTPAFQAGDTGSCPVGCTLRIFICCLDRVGKVPGSKPEVIRKDGQDHSLQTALVNSYGACLLTVRIPDCDPGDEGSTPSLYPWLT